jgi:hypothetical protein
MVTLLRLLLTKKPKRKMTVTMIYNASKTMKKVRMMMILRSLMI